MSRNTEINKTTYTPTGQEAVEEQKSFQRVINSFRAYKYVEQFVTICYRCNHMIAVKRGNRHLSLH